MTATREWTGQGVLMKEAPLDVLRVHAGVNEASLGKALTWQNTIPSSVRIGYRRYDIVVAPIADLQDFGPNPRRHFGSIEVGRIRIASEQSAHVAANTLLHEVLHGISYVYELAKSDDEERTVSIFSNGLVALAADNPRLFNWIAEQAGERDG